MTNYEKYKDVFIELLSENQKPVSRKPCFTVWLTRKNRKELGCPHFINPKNKNICKECATLNKQWLEAEAPVFDLEELEAGDKIIMRKLGEDEAWLYEVVCNSFPALWLRFRASENCVSQARDENFLIFYCDLSDKYEIHEVIKNAQ